MPLNHPYKPQIPPSKSQPAGQALLIISLLLSPFLALATLNHITSLWVRSTPVQVGLLLFASAAWAVLLYFSIRALTRSSKNMGRGGFTGALGFCLLLAAVILIPFLQDFTPLPPGQRQLVITATGEKNPASSAAQVKIMEVDVAVGQHIPLHTLEPRGEWTRLEDPQPALLTRAANPASLRLRFTSQWGQPVTLLAESGPDAGILRVEINDLQAEFDLYNSRSDLRLLTLNANTAPLAWKLLLYGVDILLLAFLLLMGGALLFSGAIKLDALLESRPRQAGALVLAVILLAFSICFSFFLPMAWQKSNGAAALQAGMALWDPWELVFLLNFLLLSSGLGIFLLKLGKALPEAGRTGALPLPPLSRFLFGACLAPIVLSLWMLLCAAILPGAPAPLFLFLPSAAGLAYTLLNLNQFPVLWQDIRQGLKSESNRPALALAWLCLAVVLAQVSAILLVNSRQAGLQNDTNVYRAMTRPFAVTRSLAGIPAFDGSSHSNLPQDAHNYIFQGYLAYPMLHAGPDEIGFPNDKPVNDAYQVLFFTMLLGVAALAWTSRRALAVPLSLLIMLQVSQIGTIGYILSRDAFRIIPLLLLLLLLGTFDLSKPLWGRHPAFQLALLGLVSFYCLAGHTLGGILCVLICLGWLLAQFLLGRKVHFASLLLVGLAAALGLLLGSGKYIQAYQAYGNVQLHIPEHVTAGTPYNEMIYQTRDSRYNEIFYSAGLGNRLLTTAIVILERDRYLVLLPGLVTALLLILLWRRMLARYAPPELALWSLASLLIFLPFIGLLDIGRILLSNAFVGNLRYQLHLYPIFAAILVVSALQLEKLPLKPLGLRWKKLHRRAVVLLVVGLLLSCLSALNRPDDNFWRSVNLRANQIEYAVRIAPVRQVQQQISPARVLHDSALIPYYLEDNALLLYTLDARDILHSTAPDQVQASLQAAGVGAVVLEKQDIVGGWQDTPLYGYLESSPQAELSFENEVLRIYRLH